MGSPASILAPSMTALLLLAMTLSPSVPPAQPDASHLRRMLERLPEGARVLYVAAHPDDENTRLLAWLVHVKKLRAGYLSITRGDGGQNLIGKEQGPALGLLRTQELLAARRLDGAEQFFTSARDFGFSKSAEESLRIWGKERILEDVVYVVRSFRPDVIVTRFSPSPRKRTDSTRPRRSSRWRRLPRPRTHRTGLRSSSG